MKVGSKKTRNTPMNHIFLPSFSSQGNPGANGLHGAKGAAVSICLKCAAVVLKVF